MLGLGGGEKSRTRKALRSCLYHAIGTARHTAYPLKMGIENAVAQLASPARLKVLVCIALTHTQLCAHQHRPEDSCTTMFNTNTGLLRVWTLPGRLLTKVAGMMLSIDVVEMICAVSSP